MPELLRPLAGAPRHSRPPGEGTGPGGPGWRLRPVRLAVGPAALVAAVFALVLTYVLFAREPAPGQGTGPLWAVLSCAVVATAVVLAWAASAALAEERARAARLAGVRRAATQGRIELQALLAKVERGERPSPPEAQTLAVPGDEPLEQLRHEIATARQAAACAVSRAARTGAEGGRDERVEVFVSLARKMQSFVQHQIEHLDELEAEAEDPDLLKGLFHIDHLATRVRRHAENLAVLGGAVPRRQWSRPVCLADVLRSCVAEVEHYSRVKLVPPFEGTVRGHAVADVVHLLAELVENATEFSPPGSHVLLRVQRVAAGLAIEVEDRGLGMTAAEQNRMNAVLAGTERLAVGELLNDGRVGLFVVATLARRHGIAVQLQANIYGGVQAVLVLPQELLGGEAEGHFVPAGRPRPAPEPAPARLASAAGPAEPAPMAALPTVQAPQTRPPLPRRPRRPTPS